MNRRNEILEHTDDLIQKHGYKGFSYADLSKRLGIAKASIHHHFPSKEDLGIAYCDSKIEAMNNFRQELRSIKKAKDQLNTYIDYVGTCIGKMCGLNAMQSDVGDMSPRLVDKVRQLSDLEFEILTEILENGLDSKEFSFLIKPYEQALIISTSIKGALLIGRVKNDDTFKKMCNALRKGIEFKPET